MLLAGKRHDHHKLPAKADHLPGAEVDVLSCVAAVSHAATEAIAI